MSPARTDLMDGTLRESQPDVALGGHLDARLPARVEGPAAFERIAREGFVTGLIGFSIIALLFALFSMLQGRSPFHAAAFLGNYLFFDVPAAADSEVGAGPVLAYNGAHLLAFIIAGFAMAALAAVLERAPEAWIVGLIALMFGAGHIFGLPLWFQAPVRDTLPLWLVVAATILAGAAMSVYLWREHPGLIRDLED